MNIASIVSSMTYRSSVLVLTTLCALGIWYAGSENREPQDAVPIIKAITPENYKEWAKNPSVVKAGLYITNFSVVNIYENRFLIDAYVWFKFNPLVVSLDAVSQFNFDKGRISEKELIDVRKVDDMLQVRYRVQCEFVSVLNFKYYPFDTHRIYIVLKSDVLSPQEMILLSDYTSTWFNPDALARNWIYNEPACEYGFLELMLDSRQPNKMSYISVAALFFDFYRASSREAMLIFMPLMLILMLMLGSFIITSMEAVLFALLGIVGMLVHRLIVNAMAPITVYYMLSDWFFILIFLCTSLVLVFKSINLLYKDKGELWLDTLRGIELTISSLIFLGGWFYLLRIW